MLPKFCQFFKFKNLFLLTFSLLFLIIILTTTAFARNSSTQSPLTVSQTVNYSSSQKRDINYIKNIVTGLNQMLVGEPVEVKQAVIDANKSQNSEPIYIATGALGSLTQVLTSLYTYPPISGIDYLADVAGNMGLIKKAYAQQSGFQALVPIQNLWRAMRNLAYMGFVIVFVITGLMIMFRARIDPRTVASIADSLPRIVIALLLVTFSYALAGFVIDLIGVSTRLIASIFAFTTTTGSFSSLFSQLETGSLNIFDLMKSVIDPGQHLDGWGDTIGDILVNIPLVGGLLGLIPGQFWGGIFGLILTIAIVFSMFRVFVMLLGALVTIILLTIFSPLQFLVSALPGRGGVLTGWGKAILSAALVFPVTFTMLLLAAIFAGTTGSPWNIDTTALIGDWTLFPAPLGGGLVPGASSRVMGSLIAIGILLTTPQAANIVRDALQQRPAPWAGAAGAELGQAARRIVPFF